ncbi:MAG: hypothetical protein WAU69_06640 [Solirubrobacteraceae bacterium]
MNGTLIFCSLCLVVGGLLLCIHVLSGRRPSLAVRLARARGETPTVQESPLAAAAPEWVRVWAQQIGAFYEERLRRAGRRETTSQFLLKKLLLCFAAPFVPLLPYAVAVQRAPSAAIVLLLAAAGSLCLIWCCDRTRSGGARRSFSNCPKRCR